MRQLLLSLGLLLILTGCEEDAERVRGQNEKRILQMKVCVAAGGFPQVSNLDNVECVPFPKGLTPPKTEGR